MKEVAATFLPIKKVNIVPQKPMDWDNPDQEDSSVIKLQKASSSRDKDRKPLTKPTLSQLPRIPKKKSPVRAIPAGYENYR